MGGLLPVAFAGSQARSLRFAPRINRGVRYSRQSVTCPAISTSSARAKPCGQPGAHLIESGQFWPKTKKLGREAGLVTSRIPFPGPVNISQIHASRQLDGVAFSSTMRISAAGRIILTMPLHNPGDMAPMQEMAVLTLCSATYEPVSNFRQPPACGDPACEKSLPLPAQQFSLWHFSSNVGGCAGFRE